MQIQGLRCKLLPKGEMKFDGQGQLDELTQWITECVNSIFLQ